MGSKLNHLKSAAIALRKQGKSYNAIMKALGLKSKGTLSYWFKKITLSTKSHKLLEHNKLLAHKRGLIAANQRRNDKINQEKNVALTRGINAVSKISEQELLLIGAALYWGEGTKSEKVVSTPLVFSNSDPMMIRVYMRFLREILKIPEEKIKAGIHIYATISDAEARAFWSAVTGIKKEVFYIVTQISRASQGKRPYNSLPYGTAVIKVNNRIQFYKVKGMIQGIIQRLTEK